MYKTRTYVHVCVCMTREGIFTSRNSIHRVSLKRKTYEFRSFARKARKSWGTDRREESRYLRALAVAVQVPHGTQTVLIQTRGWASRSRDTLRDTFAFRQSTHVSAIQHLPFARFLMKIGASYEGSAPFDVTLRTRSRELLFLFSLRINFSLFFFCLSHAAQRFNDVVENVVDIFPDRLNHWLHFLFIVEFLIKFYNFRVCNR